MFRVVRVDGMRHRAILPAAAPARTKDDMANIGKAGDKRLRRQQRNQRILFKNAAADFTSGRKSINQVRTELGLPLVENDLRVAG